jgi:hypothetical protein
VLQGSAKENVMQRDSESLGKIDNQHDLLDFYNTCQNMTSCSFKNEVFAFS